MTYIHWLIFGGLLTVAEIFTGTFVMLWFAIGAFTASLLCFFHLPVWLHWAAFACVSLVLFAIFHRYPFLVCRFPKASFGCDRLIGQRGRVIKAIAPDIPGQIKIDGETWMAVCERNVPVGEAVTVEKIEGTKAVVVPVPEVLG